MTTTWPSRAHEGLEINISNQTASDSLDAITESNQKASPLLRLPAELGNIVYGHVLGGREINVMRGRDEHGKPQLRVRIYVGDRLDPSSSFYADPRSFAGARPENEAIAGAPSHTFALLKVCRQIYQEAHLLPFRLNTFYLPSQRVSTLWAAAVESRIDDIETIRVLGSSLHYTLETRPAPNRWSYMPTPNPWNYYMHEPQLVNTPVVAYHDFTRRLHLRSYRGLKTVQVYMHAKGTAEDVEEFQDSVSDEFGSKLVVELRHYRGANSC